MNTKQITQISCLENLIEESKVFLDALKQHAGPMSIIISTLDSNGNNIHAILYELNKYILIIPSGNQQQALMYGNWEEALYASKRYFLSNLGMQAELKVSIGRYLQ